MLLHLVLDTFIVVNLTKEKWLWAEIWDGYNSYAQRGNLPTLQHVLSEGVAMFPNLSRLKILRTWGGIMDMSMDGSPVIDKTHIDGLYLNFGWCYGGFKATPVSGWTFAYTIAQDQAHELNSKYKLNRFNTGHLIDEKGCRYKNLDRIIDVRN